MPPIPVLKSTVSVAPDPTRVIARRFEPGGATSSLSSDRVDRIVARLVALPEAEVSTALASLRARFADRHKDLRADFEENFASVASRIEDTAALSSEQLLLIGAYFTHEYAIEAAALSNPSIVVAPDQDGLQVGETRFVMSLRAIGEGHMSSIEFRSGVVDAAGNVEVDAPSQFVGTARHQTPIYDRALFSTKLTELRAYGPSAAAVLERLPDHFTLQQLETEIRRVNSESDSDVEGARMTRTLHWLASSNYESSFSAESLLSERVLFPSAPAESCGMEDARFVRFTREDDSVVYFAPYTAYDGYQILPQLIETTDFVTFRMATLNGACATNKGIALFPRKIDGRYAALARLDNENNFLMYADDVRFWHEAELLQTPQAPWELIQIGNGGSPMETEAGWLVITHGVGAMRQYALGALLLDLEDPSRVIGHLSEPLLQAADDERDGYVPNVVYSCGSIIVGDHLVLPYGFSDVGTRIATVSVDDLIARLVA
jgi:predicted GH43/DUF377 family glycosyl hydrolase